MSRREPQPAQSLPELHLARTIFRVMDEAFTVPGTNFKFGIDPLLGFLPVAGDAVSLVVSGLVVMLAVRQGVNFSTLLKMTGNVMLDFLVGSIPVLGNIFDFGFKANRRNLSLLEKFYASGKPAHSAGVMAFWLSIGVFLLLLGACVAAMAIGLMVLQSLLSVIGG